MSPATLDQNVTEALRVLGDQTTPGPLSERLEAAVDSVTRAAIDARATELGGAGARSKAIREMLQEGAKAMAAKRRRRA